MNVHLYRQSAPAARWPSGIARWLSDWRKVRGQKIDPESLSEHMRRDLGLLGGREPPLRDLLRD